MSENELHPSDTFKGVVKVILPGEASTGTRFIGVSVETEHGVLPVQLWLSDKALEGTKQKLSTNLDWVGEFSRREDVERLLAIRGTEVMVKVEHDDYRGKITAKADFAGKTVVYKGDEGVDKILSWFSAKPTPSPQSRPAPKLAEDDDGNIPF
jgi:hypothetical protein